MRLILACVLALGLIAAPAGAQLGDLDRSFGQSGRASIAPPGQSALPSQIAVQPNGRIVVLGTGRRGWTVSRLTLGGRLDRTFGTRGRVVIGQRSGTDPLALALLPDGRIVAGGSLDVNGATATAQLVRLLPDGGLDPSFGQGGHVSLRVPAPARLFFGGLALLPDGGLALTGSVHERDQRLTVWRLRPDGSLETGFGDGGTYVDPQPGAGATIAARPDGRLLVGGETGTYYSYGERELVLALTADGRVDTSWGHDGRFVGPMGSQVRSLLLAPDGSAVALDWLPAQASVLWLTPDGQRRETWGLDGRAPLGERTTPAYYTRAIALDGDGQVYVAGAVFYRRRGERQELAAVTRVGGSGRLDRAFGRAGTARIPATKRIPRSLGEAIAIGPGERVYLAASGASELQGFREDFGYTQALVARFEGWPRFASIHDPNALPDRRWTMVDVACTRSCRARLTISDRRGRRLGRATGSVRPHRARSFRVRLSRRLRRGERITIRLRARDRTGRVDDVMARGRVRRPS